MANINKIRLSGQTYNIQDENATKTLELTQAQYDALVVKDPNTFYIITDAQGVDLSNYYTKSETSGATEISTALDAKQDTLVSGTNIKTINNESILGSGNIDIQGGGGKAVSGGTNISITTGETADTINCTLPYSKINGNGVIYDLGSNTISGKVYDSLISGIGNSLKERNNTRSTNYNIVMGYQNNLNVYSTEYSDGNNIIIGKYNKISADTNYQIVSSVVIGTSNTSTKSNQFICGYGNVGSNNYETLLGERNISNYNSVTFGNSGNTLFSIGNGDSFGRGNHNALEIRQNGDIYIADTNDTSTSNFYEKPMIKLQDHLGGGGSITVESAITSGSINAVESKAIWSATTFNKDVLLTFNNSQSTNYPKGCGKLVVENIGGYEASSIDFRGDSGITIGHITITQNWDNSITVDTSNFEGATYEISGTTVIISYPSTSITYVTASKANWSYTAVVEGAWVNENTYMNVEVDAIANGLQNNINSKLDATAYTPTVVDSALNVASTNPIQNQALYSELRIDNGETETTLTFENKESTNYPNGCTKLIVEDVGLNTYSDINFFNGNQPLGHIMVSNWGSITVDTSRFEGASYEISGTTVIINYPTVTSVTRIRLTDNGNYVYKAIVANATALKDQVTANTTALGGLKLVKLTQSEYDALSPNYDSNTLYIIIN